jgi:hypothetical protein
MKTKIKLERQDILFYGLIFAFTLLRVLTSKIYPCRTDFDCNSYIQMANTLVYDPHILPHHAMRILPSYLVHLLHDMGFAIPLAFRCLSDSCYVLFGLLTFWMLRQHQVKSIIAFAFSLLCLAPHHAMRQPLQDVYQLCDIMTYPLALLLIHFTLLKNGRWVFAISVLGLLTKQTLFGFGGLSLAYCFLHTRRNENIIYMGLLALGYLGLQTYYHAFSIVTSHLIPTDDFFTVSHLVEIFNQSKLIDLFVPLLPLLLIYSSQVFVFLYRHWHVAIYMAVVVGQPFIAFHLTGNNFQRLALQGVWILYLIVGLSTVQKPWNKTLEYPLAIYTLAVYFTWGMSQRMILMGIFTLICLFYYIYSIASQRAQKLEFS